MEKPKKYPSLYAQVTGKEPDSFAVSTAKAVGMVPVECLHILFAHKIRWITAALLFYGSYSLNHDVHQFTDAASHQLITYIDDFLTFENMSRATPIIDHDGNLCIQIQSDRFDQQTQVGTCSPVKRQ